MSSSSPSHLETVTVVVTTHNEGENLRRTVHNLLATLPASGEIVVVDDCSTDGSTEFLNGGYGAVTVTRPFRRLGVAGARNHGASLARGDVLVFSDAHVETPLGWVESLCAPLRAADVAIVGPAISALGHPDMKGYGLTWSGPSLDVQWLPRHSPTPYAVPFLCGCFTAMRRDVFEQVGGFDAGMTTWGIEDTEIGLRTWLLGYQCLLVPDVEVAHLFRPRFPYQVDWEAVVHNALRLGAVHFSTERLAQVAAAFAKHAAFPAALARLLDGDSRVRRAALRARRRFDDVWFFDRFGISFETA